MTADMIFAVSLLLAPAGTPEQTPPPERWAEVTGAIHRVAIDWEIMDKRECRYICGEPNDYQSDLDLLRRRRVEYADLPRLNDGAWLPRGPVVDTYIEFNRDHLKHLDKRLIFEPDRADLLLKAICETQKLYGVLDGIREGTSELSYVTSRRKALGRVRDRIGQDAWDKCVLPECVPSWTFAPGGK